jgi:hypothetical protein
MARPNKATQALEQVGGIDWALSQLEDGVSMRDMARKLNVPTMSLYARLHDNPVHSARVVASMAAGAEFYEAEAARILADTYDKLDCETPHPHASSLAGLARERAQAAWRMAGSRDPARFGDNKRTTVAITVSDTRTIPTAELERLVAQQTLELAPDGTVGGTSD